MRIDALGYDSIWVTDRLLIPKATASVYPYSPTGILPIGPDEPWLDDDTDSGSPVPLAGPPAKIIEDLGAYVAAGVEHFVLDFSVTAVPEMLDVLERFAADIRPRVRA